MLGAFGWGFLASFSLVLGGLLACLVSLRERTLGLIMAFGAGVLISAVAYELVFEAVTMAKGTGFPTMGLFAGAGSFFIADRFIGALAANQHGKSDQSSQAGLVVPMVLAIVLDGIPESVAIGLGILQGGAISLAMLFAVFISNIPEAVAGTTGMKSAGWSNGKIFTLWILISLVCGVASAAGYTLLASVPETWMAFVQTFAAGAILTMLANSMIPEAYEYGKKLSGLMLVFGFALAVWVIVLEHS